MNAAGRVWQRLARLLAPWGELGWDILLQRSLLDELPEVKPAVEVTLRLAGPEDIDTLVDLYATDPWLYIGDATPSPGSRERARELYLDRLRRGEQCFLAMCSDSLAHVNWTCFSWGDVLPDHPIRLREGEIFTTDAVTLRPFRGKHLHTFVLRAMLEHARQRGYRQAYTLSRIDRTDSLKGLHEIGWKECGWMLYFLPKGASRTRFLWRHGNLEPLFRPT
jgi:GNAT superfamily N-acetyltransferase